MLYGVARLMQNGSVNYETNQEFQGLDSLKEVVDEICGDTVSTILKQSIGHSEI